ncbi:hypothetical protein QYE76_022190 [Lolium multiflorum]|uniref:Uncharacterized protein n=1 Tax=Lolium multiflorum TaxID=4521 RepID=A0AAD8R7Y4_LOLMU|nr:hypothetical protein QYE76_022190 [Lolium multiflorum]
MDGDHGWAKLTSVVHYNRGKMKTAAAHTLVEPDDDEGMVQFVDVLPQYEFDPLYYGIEQNTKNRCGHSVFPARRVCNDGYDTGRREYIHARM